MATAVAAVSGLLLAQPAVAGNPDPVYSGTAVALCQGDDDPIIEATNTGTGDITFAVGGTGFPLPAGQDITVQWPSDASGPLPQADWQMLIPGTDTVIDSGTLALPDCTPDPPTTDPVTTEAPTTNPSGPTATATAPRPGPDLPETGSTTLWIALTAVGFVLAGSALYTLRRRPN